MLRLDFEVAALKFKILQLTDFIALSNSFTFGSMVLLF